MNGNGIKWVGAGSVVAILVGGLQIYNFGNKYIDDKLADERDRMALEQRIDRLEMQVCDLDPETKWRHGRCVPRDHN